MGKGCVFVAMSGGVDSSVAAALLLEQGYDVVGVTMRLWTGGGEELPRYQRSCCSVEAVDDARRICQLLGIPHYFLNFEPQFEAYVVAFAVEEYRRGRTPNPCLACNRWVKFRFFRERALALGANFIATGHYARIEEEEGRYRLFRGVDPAKDQSYFLYTLNQEELAHLLLPLGGYRKDEVRGKAAGLGLPVADKPDSQELCFIPDGDLAHFLSERVCAEAGPIVDSRGQELGRHRGIAFYTVGQRHGLGLAAGRPLYVRRLEAATNTVVVGPADELFSDHLVAGEVNFVSGEMPRYPLEVVAKVRYRSPAVLATLFPGEAGVELRFREPQRAIAPGQAVVFYQADEVLGGGLIESTTPSLLYAAAC